MRKEKRQTIEPFGTHGTVQKSPTFYHCQYRQQQTAIALFSMCRHLVSRISWPIIRVKFYHPGIQHTEIRKTSKRTVSKLCIRERVEFLPTVGFCQETLYFSRSFQAVLFCCNAITLRKLCSEQGFYLSPYTLTLHNSFQHPVQFTAVLLKWKQKDGPAASYECLAQALQHPILGKSELATKYCHLSRETGESGFCVTSIYQLSYC